MFDELNEKDMAAIHEVMSPIIKELVNAWGDGGNKVMKAHREELEGMFPKRSHKIARMAIMSALPPFIRNCCLSISPSTQLQLAAALSCEVMAAALAIDKEYLEHEHTLMQSLMSVSGGEKDGDKTDDDDRGPAEH